MEHLCSCQIFLMGLLVEMCTELSELIDGVISWNINGIIKTFVQVMCNLIYEAFKVLVLVIS